MLSTREVTCFFLDDNTLMAQPFDTDRLTTTGEPVPVAERVQSVLGSGRVGAFTASETGLIAYYGKLGRAGCGSNVVRSQWPAWDDGWQCGEAGCV